MAWFGWGQVQWSEPRVLPRLVPIPNLEKLLPSASLPSSSVSWGQVGLSPTLQLLARTQSGPGTAKPIQSTALVPERRCHPCCLDLQAFQPVPSLREDEKLAEGLGQSSWGLLPTPPLLLPLPVWSLGQKVEDISGSSYRPAASQAQTSSPPIPAPLEWGLQIHQASVAVSPGVGGGMRYAHPPPASHNDSYHPHKLPPDTVGPRVLAEYPGKFCHGLSSRRPGSLSFPLTQPPPPPVSDYKSKAPSNCPTSIAQGGSRAQWPGAHTLDQ